MLKKKVNGAWSVLDNVMKKTDGTWSDCTSVKKKYNGVWVNVWWVKEAKVETSHFKNNLSNDNWYYIDYVPAERIESYVGENEIYLNSFGSSVITSDSSQGGAFRSNAGPAAGESLYIDQRCYWEVSPIYSQSVYAYALLFDGPPDSTTNPKRALAKASLTKSRQTITLTTTSNTASLCFYLGFTSSGRSTERPYIYLDVYGIRTDSGRYIFKRW